MKPLSAAFTRCWCSFVKAEHLALWCVENVPLPVAVAHADASPFPTLSQQRLLVLLANQVDEFYVEVVEFVKLLTTVDFLRKPQEVRIARLLRWSAVLVTLTVAML